MCARFVFPLGSLLLALAGACASGTGTSDAPAPDLLASVQATTSGDGVQFLLQVTNTTEAPVELEFRSGQQFDFVVRRDAEEVWRWSADQMFTQAIRHQTVAPGETVSFSAAWRPAPAQRGEYSVTGVLTAAEHRLEQQAQFRIP